MILKNCFIHQSLTLLCFFVIIYLSDFTNIYWINACSGCEDMILMVTLLHSVYLELELIFWLSPLMTPTLLMSSSPGSWITRSAASMFSSSLSLMVTSARTTSSPSLSRSWWRTAMTTLLSSPAYLVRVIKMKEGFKNKSIEFSIVKYAFFKSWSIDF